MAGNTCKECSKTKDPGFKKHYPRGGFWIDYALFQSTSLTYLDVLGQFLRNQQNYQNITLLGKRQFLLN